MDIEKISSTLCYSVANNPSGYLALETKQRNLYLLTNINIIQTKLSACGKGQKVSGWSVEEGDGDGNVVCLVVGD